MCSYTMKGAMEFQECLDEWVILKVSEKDENTKGWSNIALMNYQKKLTDTQMDGFLQKTCFCEKLFSPFQYNIRPFAFFNSLIRQLKILTIKFYLRLLYN